MTIKANFKAELQGSYDFIIHGGKRGRLEYLDSANLITTLGIDRLLGTTSSLFTHCQVGTGSATPAATDTALQSFFTSSNTKQGSDTNTYVAGPPDYIEGVMTWRFVAGTFSGTNLSEVGVGGQANGLLFSRARITVGGSPGSITVLADETLDVVYRLRVYPPASDVTGSITLNGNVHNYTIRPAKVNVNAFPAAWQPTGLSSCVGASGTFSSSNSWACYSGGLGSRTSEPSGLLSLMTGTAAKTPQTYTNGSGARTVRYAWGLNDGNATPGIGFRSIILGAAMGSSAIMLYQIEFVPNIDKRSTMIFNLDVAFSFANRP